MKERILKYLAKFFLVLAPVATEPQSGLWIDEEELPDVIEF